MKQEKQCHHKKDKWLNLLIFAGAIIVGFGLIAGAIHNFAKDKRYVEVKGLAEREVKADEVYWPITFQVRESDITAFNSKVQQDIETTKQMLVSRGISEDEIAVQPLRVNNYNAGFNNQEMFDGNVTISVYSNKVDLVRDITQETAALLEEGVLISGWESPSYYFTKLNDIKPEMLAEATQNARVAAGEFAKESQSNVGNIAMAQQGIFSINEKDPGSPEIKEVRVVSTIRFFLD